MNPEYEGSTFYIQDENGNMTPLVSISYAEIELCSLNDDNVYEIDTTFKKLSEVTFEATCVITELGWHLRKYYTNNWRRNHGWPLIRRRKKR